MLLVSPTGDKLHSKSIFLRLYCTIQQCALDTATSTPSRRVAPKSTVPHPQFAQAENPLAFEAMMIPMMTPKSPSALPKISTTRILTNSSGFCASERAQLEPAMPTQMPHARFEKPTLMPAAKSV